MRYVSSSEPDEILVGRNDCGALSVPLADLERLQVDRDGNVVEIGYRVAAKNALEIVADIDQDSARLDTRKIKISRNEYTTVLQG
jgi:hypothetical protein